MKTVFIFTSLLIVANLAGCTSAEKKVSPGVVDSQTAVRKGDFWLKRGCIEKAKRYYEGSMQTAERIDSRYLTVQSMNRLTAVSLMANNYEQALAYAEKAVNLIDESIDPDLQSSIFGNLASIAYGLGKQEDAEMYWQKSLSRAKQHNIKSQQLITLANMGRAKRLSGDKRASEAALAEAMSIMQGDPDYKNANVLLQYGLLLRDKGDNDAAQSRIAEALALDREQEFTFGIAHDLRWLGEILLKGGKIKEGKANLDRSFFLFLALGSHESLAAILATMKSFPGVFEAQELEKYVSAISTSDPKDAGAPDLCSF